MKKKGISLILLVITIIIIIIIASAVILNLNNNNPVDKARLANVQSTRDSLKSGINLYIGKIMVDENGNHRAQTMILGKNTEVIDYSIIHDYSMYETIRGNLNIWQLDYTAINEKVNIKLDIYDNNSRWYIDEWGNPFLVYNSLINVSPYLKTEDSTDILASVKDFVVVLDNVEFAENSTLGIANANKTSITSAVKRYLGANASSLNEIADSSNVKIIVNGADTSLYKLNISNLNTKAGTNLTDTYDSADWYIDENGNTYLIYEVEEDIPEEMKNGVSTNSYVTVNGGTITGYTVSDNSNNNELNDTVYAVYNSCEKVTTVDGNKWIVVKNSGENESSIRIMSEDNVKNNVTTAVTGTNIFSTSYYDYKRFYNSTGNANYEESNTKRYLENNVKPALENSLNTTISYIGIWGEEDLTSLGCTVTWNSDHSAVSSITVPNSRDPIFYKSGRYSWIALKVADKNNVVWYMHEYGVGGHEYVTNTCHGLRPIIEVPKSVIITND